MLGPDVIGKLSFVARTISSRFAYSRIARPVTSSLAPSEYMSAVSKKLIPRLDGLAEERLRGGLVEHPRAPLGTAETHASEGEARDGESGAT